MAPPVRKLRILLLVHTDLVPPKDWNGMSDAEKADIKTEYSVYQGLRKLGHEVLPLGLGDELAPLRYAIKTFKPHIAFNLMEEFQGEAIFDYAVVSYLELLGVAYTGCNPRGMLLARDKALSKKILHYHRVRVPRFHVLPRDVKVKVPKNIHYPVIVKSLVEEASLGISQASVVDGDDKLIERVGFMHRSIGTDVIVEQFIEGRELYLALLGNHRVEAFPLWELDVRGLPEKTHGIATRKVKWDREYQERYNIKIREVVDLSDEQTARIQALGKRIYRILGLSGYARVDFRLAPDGRVYFLEANPNPDIQPDAEFAGAAWTQDMKYEELLQKIVTIGLRQGGSRQLRAAPTEE